MSFDFILNELSYRTPAQNIYEAKLLMQQFVKTLSDLRKATQALPYLPSLRVDHSFLYAQLAPNYNVAQWREDAEVDSITRGLFKSFVGRGPYLHDLLTAVTDEFPTVYEYTFGGAPCLGLGYTHLLRGFAVSLGTENCWNESSLTIMGRYLSEDGDDEFVVDIPHASGVAHVTVNSDLIAVRVEDDLVPVTNLTQLWAALPALFPNLRFVGEVEGQLNQLDHKKHVSGIRSSLASFNDYAARWSASESEFSHKEMAGVTPESGRRINTYGGLMTFEWLDENRLFQFHGRFTPGAGRIHMWPDLARRELIIGYIGMKIGL
jgi:hypothetical protein